MSTITKQWLQQKISDMEAARDEIPFGLNEDDSNTLAALRIALASLEAEAVVFVMADDLKDSSIISTPAYRDYGEAMERTVGDVVALYTAPPAPASLPDESAVELLATDLMKRIDKITGERHSVATLSSLRVSIVEACRAAMLQGGKP